MRGAQDAERIAKAIRAASPAWLDRWQAQARRVDRKLVTRAYEALYATDLAIKQGRTDPETALTLCVLDLCGVANADPRELVLGEPTRRYLAKARTSWRPSPSVPRRASSARCFA